MRWTIVLLVALVGVACVSRETGWERVGEDRWSRHHAGRTWLDGIELGDGFRARGERGQRLRARLLNPGPAPVEVALTGGDNEGAITVPAGASADLDVGFAGAEVRLDGPADVVVGEPRVGRPLRDRRLIVVILVDTLRDDHVSSELTPGIVAAFSDGVRCADTSANAPWTLPSVASFFASEPPLALSLPSGDLVGVPTGTATWPLALADAGFAGGAVVANYTVHAQNGFAPGFATYLVPSSYGPGGHPDATWVVAEGRRWLDAHGGEDAFVYLHLMDPHEPYRDHGRELPTAPELAPLAHRERDATAAEAGVLAERYAAEVRHVDDVLAPFLAALPPEAVVVLTADHGEALGEHGAWGHGLNLYREALAVPLLVRGRRAAELAPDRPVQLLDLGPTVLDVAGVEAPASFVGRSLFAGGSDRAQVAVTFGAGPMRWAWRAGRHVLLLRTAPQAVSSPPEEAKPLPAGAFAFDLRADPDELDPRPLEERQRRALTPVLARSAGALVPGVQLLVGGATGAAEIRFRSSLPLELTQVWSVAGVDAESSDRRNWTIRISESAPLAYLAWRVPEPPSITYGSSSIGWASAHAGDTVAGDQLPLAPADDLVGAALWWSSGREVVVEAQEETERRLRALGYID